MEGVAFVQVTRGRTPGHLAPGDRGSSPREPLTARRSSHPPPARTTYGQSAVEGINVQGRPPRFWCEQRRRPIGRLRATWFLFALRLRATGLPRDRAHAAPPSDLRLGGATAWPAPSHGSGEHRPPLDGSPHRWPRGLSDARSTRSRAEESPVGKGQGRPRERSLEAARPRPGFANSIPLPRDPKKEPAPFGGPVPVYRSTG